MAEIELIKGADNGNPPDKLSEAYPKVNRNFAKVSAAIDAVDSKAGQGIEMLQLHEASEHAHNADSIDYQGEVLGAGNVKQGIDNLKMTVDQLIVVGDSGPEAAAARYSTPFNRAYATLKDRVDATDERVKNLGIVNVADYEIADSAGIQSLIDSLPAESVLYFPDGIYPMSFSLSKDIDLVLSPNAKIEGTVTAKGVGIPKSGTTSLVGDWAVFPVGTTVFPGNFSALRAGDIVLVETGAQDGLYNQVGIDLLTVQTASATQLVTTQGTKFSYKNPSISKTTSIYKTGTVAEGAFYIPGNFTSLLAAGDIVRLDNRDGTAGVENSSAYFELARVVTISSSGVTLENRLSHTFTNFWVSKFNTLKNVRIDGGYIRDLTMQNAESISIRDSQFSDIHLQYIYDFGISDLDFDNSGTPQAFELTFAYSGSVSNIRARGARGITDNGNIKFMSLVNVVVNNLVSMDSYATAEGVYPFFTDYYFTPYKNWNDRLIMNNVSVAGNKNEEASDLWIIGAKNSQFSNLNTYWWAKFDLLVRCQVSSLTSEKRLIVSASKNTAFSNVSSGALDISNLSDSYVSGADLTTRDALYSRAVWVRGSKNLRFENVRVAPGDVDSFYLEQSDGIDISGCSDNLSLTGVGVSVMLDAGIANFRLGSNDFKKAIGNVSRMSTTRHFGVPKAVLLTAFSLGRNSYAAKVNLTGDGTEYRCVFDADGVHFNKTEYGADPSGTFTCPSHLAGKYRFSAQIGLSGIESTHAIAQLYLKINSTKVSLDYQNLSVGTGTKSILLKGQALVQLAAGDVVQCFVVVSGTSKTVSWDVGDFGGRFSGEMIFAE